MTGVIRTSLSVIQISNVQNPYFRYAGVYTVEEAVSEARDTLKLLQEAYQRQMGRLRVLLQDARARCVSSLKAEKEQYCEYIHYYYYSSHIC